MESFWWLDSEESQGHGTQMARYIKESTQWNSSQGIERAFPRPQIPQIPLRELFKSFKLRHCNLNILLQSVNSSRGILHLTTLTQQHYTINLLSLHLITLLAEPQVSMEQAI